MLTDTHSHIQFKQFPDSDEVIERAESAGVTRQIIVGCTPKDSLLALEMVKKYPDKKLWAAVGVHCHDASKCNEEILQKFERLARDEEKVVALGEMGLDYYRDFQPRDIQKEAFRAQLQLAKELKMPAIIHVRDAWEDAMDILAEIGNSKVILHSFTGNMETAQEAWKRGYYTSFSGMLTYPKNEYLREIAGKAPEDLILVETDCPYLSPQPYRGKRNEPAYTVETAKTLAEVRGVKPEEIAKTTTQNAIRIFGIT